MSEDNPLANVDLGVVTAARAPQGFAEGVLARFATTEAAIAVAKRGRGRRMAWIAGGSLAAAAAVIAVVVLWPASNPEPRTRVYVAAQRQHLNVDGLAVELERGATVAWTVDGDTVHVDQRGDATWTVPAGHHLRVEAAGVGAVDATDATFRVEARMNLMESKLIGAAALSGAVAAAFAVTVTQGKAMVIGAGKGIVISAGQSAAVSPDKEPVVALTMDVPIAVEVVFSGEATWTEHNLDAFESAIDHVELPPGSTIGAVSYASGAATLRAEATPKSRFGAGWLGFVNLHRAGKPGGLAQGVMAGLMRLEGQHEARRLLVIVGDGGGNDPAGDNARQGLRTLRIQAENEGIEVRAVIVPGRSETPTRVEAAGIPVIDAGKLELTHALAQAMDGAVEPPAAVMMVYEGRGMWLNPDVLQSLGDALANMDLAPDSRVGAIEFSTGASVRVPLEPATSFQRAQLGTAKDYAAKRGSDLVQGVMMGLAELAHAPESNKVLIVVGDGHDTNDDAAVGIVKDLVAQAERQHVRIRAVQLGSLDTLPGDVLKRLDPHVATPGGVGYQGRLQGVIAFIIRAAEKP